MSLVAGTSMNMIVHPEVGKWLIALGEKAFGMDPFGWRIDAAYDQFSERENTAGFAADPSLLTVNADLKFRMPFGETGRSHAYALGGLTYGRYKDMIIGPQTDVRLDSPAAVPPAGITINRGNSDDWGWNAGGGLAFGLGAAAVGGLIDLGSATITAEPAKVPSKR